MLLFIRIAIFLFVSFSTGNKFMSKLPNALCKNIPNVMLLLRRFRKSRELSSKIDELKRVLINSLKNTSARKYDGLKLHPGISCHVIFNKIEETLLDQTSPSPVMLATFLSWIDIKCNQQNAWMQPMSLYS